ncbi:GNAT family N-acetyltransferase [Acinetobacter baumannii]|uniref:GNAT family N-acetyltransferase n=1 Tax=Acinetobacter baumannii TaxID=470 RepID=UPI001BCFC648|nr:GNAT family N-acetyltransferase [Acinetobacter baumannii]MBS4737523.1 GNAT family N-acetyltransferase [Acinetobacter baumannii]MCH1775426.1 GNAT family N-acetyltransferase [Acinetobacter baumannii]MCR0004663.1 GNAT family N-acetyltransferase [Acinetobacter baumannii]HCQ9654379.1 GNAT family N-acetyltransferase [Acinetobacter baumannii]HDI2491692.1 GNAT family N-acetyltransferase [Acinetobacter baumannii]
MSDQNANITIGELFNLNQGKNPTQIADTEARARKAARSLGLDYNKMTETPEQIVSVADEVNTQKRVNEVVASDPVLGKYALNPNQAAVSLDDFENLKDISDKVSLLGSSLNKPYEPVSYQDIQNVLSKGTSPEQKKRLKELGIYEDPQKQVKPNVNPNLLDTLSTSLVPQTSDQVFKENYDRIKKTAGVMSAERFKKYYENQVYWMEHTASAEPSNPQEQGNRYVNAAIRAVAAIGQTEGAIISAATGNDSLLKLATHVKNKAAPSQEMTQALYQAQLAAQTNDAGVLGAAQELVSNADAGLVGEFLIEQAPPALVGYYAGAGAGGVLTNSLIRNTAKYAPMVMNLEKAAKLVRGVTTAGNAAQGALGAGTADALVSYGQNMAEAREKFLTKQEQIDYAAAKTWGSAKYSALGGALMPVTFGGPLRTVGGQAVIQSAAGMYSVQGAADAVGEKADPVEMALEGLLEVATAAPEVAITSASKVKNQRTAQFALDQLRQDQQEDAARSSTFASVLNNLIDRNKESKTAQRDDSASQAFIKQAVEEHGAVEEVYIDGQTFNQLLRDRNIEPTDLFERAPSLQDQLGTAETFNGTVQIPVNEFVSAMSVVERPTDFVENVRSSPDMPTYREAQENLAKTTEQMQQEADTYMAEQARFESAEDAKELVATEVQNQLAKVGTFTAKYNRAAAKYNRAAGELTSAFYSTLGDKIGISAKEAFDRYPIRIADESTTDKGISFNQSATPEQTISVDEFAKSIKKQYGIELGLKGSPSSNVLSLHKIVVPEAMRNQGNGTKAMQDIIRYADSQNKTIALTPSSDFGGNKSRLTSFYKKLGFVENKGRNKDYEISESMYRSPNGRKYNQANGGTRGSITFNIGKDGSTIILSKNADFSTFVHELGHHFLEMNMQLALSPDAPAQVRADMETVMKWASPETTDLGEWDFFTDAEKTEVHEKFAETFEQYVFTGKAPSAALKQVFNRFRQFMIAVYRNIEKFMGINDRAELNSDITGVMDRMLASSSAIAEAQAASNLEMLIHQDDAMRLGISPKDYDEMRQDHEIATELSINTLEQKSLRNVIWYQKQKSKYLKTLQKEADKKRAAVREDMAKEIAQEPVYQAMAFLRQPLDQVAKRDSTKVEPERDNLFEAIAKFGGLDANEVESTWGIDEAAKTKSGVGNKPVVRSSKSKVKGLSIESMAEKLSEEGYLTLDEHGKFDTRELEDKFAEQLRGVNQYSTQVDPELLDYSQDLDLLQRYAEGRTTKGKLSLDWIEAKYGRDSDIYQRISKGAYGFAQRGGENPDVVAEMFGYESGDALIRDLLNSPSPKQKIDELTDARMAVQYSEFFDQQSIIEAVEAALHNDVRARMLSAEMAALNGLLGRESALNEAAKTVAQDIVQRQKIKDIRPHVRAQDDARLGRMANEAFRKGETVEAARHKRNQLVQFYATKYSYDAKDQIQKHLDLVKKVFGNNEKLSKNRDFDFVTAARGILGKYDLGRESTNYEHQLELIRKYDPTTYAEIQNIGALPENQNYRELTLEQFNAVMAAVETLWHRSKENKIWHTTNEAFEREQVREELIQQTGGKKSVEKIQQTLLGRDKTAELKAKFMELGASAKRVDQVVTWLDGGASGKFRTYLINPMQDALAKYRIEKAKMLKDVVDIFEGFGKLDNSKIAAPELNNFTFVGKQSLLHAILHTGNLSNKERLVLGYGWGARLEDGSVDFSAWDQFFSRMVKEGVITKKDMDNIQKLWNLFDKYKEQAQITHKKINGRYFDELPRTPISTPFGEYEGGYVPAAYDRIRSNEQDRIQDKNLAENNLAALDIATTGANFTKSRADRYHDQLELDMSRLPSHLDKELRYIHLELQIRQIGRLLLNKDFRNEIERVLPFGVKQVFNPWLKAIANQTVDESSGVSLLDNIFRTLRRNTGIAIMAGNLKNAVEQFTGFTQVAVAVPPKQLLKAQAHYFASVATREDMANNIMEMSDFMKTRFDRAADEYRYAVDEIVFQKGAIQTVKDFTMKHAYVLQTTIQRPMEMISWQAAFNHYTEQGMTQYEAVHAADAVIRQYMTDMSPEGISNLERGTPAKRMFLMFYNWFNMVWNTSMSEAKLALEASNGSWVQASPRLAYVALMMISIPSMLSELLGVIFAGGLKDEDDDDNKWDDLSAKLALSQLKMLAAFVPYAGNVVNAAISNTDDTIVNDRYTASPVFSMGESGLSLIQHARRALDEDKEVNQGKASKDLMNTATLVTGIPFAVLGKPSGYWLDIAQGKKDAPDSIYDATRGTITGKHAPEN